jgi:hypothetical protein
MRRGSPTRERATHAPEAKEVIDHLSYLFWAWPSLGPSDLTHLTPQVWEVLREVKDYSRRLADAYLATWGQLPDLETRAEFLRHTLGRAIFGHDDPGDRRALIAAGFFLASRLCDEVALAPLAPGHRIRQYAERVYALYRYLLDGKEISFKILGMKVVARVDIREGTRVTNLAKSPEIDRSTWEVYLGQPRQPQENSEASRGSQWYGSIAGATWLPCLNNDQRALEGKIAPEVWAEQWDLLWRRILFRVLIEPGVSATLRQMFAHIAFNMVSSHYHVHRALAETHDLAPFDPGLEIWCLALRKIHAGTSVLIAPVASPGARDHVLGEIHFEAGERVVGILSSVLDESIMATFARVTECELRHVESPTRKSDGKRRVQRLLH